MKVSPEDVKKLREMTGAPMMDAKNALVQAEGDFEGAIGILRKAGAAAAAKKADREARNGLVESYVHAGKIGVLVEVYCETDFVARTDDFKNFAHDVAIQVAGAAPIYVSPQDIPEDVIEKEKEIFRSELESQKKPAAVWDKIIAGKLEKYYETVCLTKQPFVKDPDKTIEQLTNELVGKLGENIVVRQMVRLELGHLL